MFEKMAHANRPTQIPGPVLQFVSVEIMPTHDGLLSVSLAGTYLDEERLEFVNDEFDGAKVSSIEEALAVIGRLLSTTLRPSAAQGGH